MYEESTDSESDTTTNKKKTDAQHEALARICGKDFVSSGEFERARTTNSVCKNMEFFCGNSTLIVLY